jgi:HlyD family secretion protein
MMISSKGVLTMRWTGRPLLVVTLSVLAGLAACSRNNSKGRIFLSGNIELTEVKAAFKIPGKLLELHAEEGSLVTQGMVLARLDPEQIRRTHGRDQASRKASETQLVQMQTAVEYQRASLAAELELRRASIQQAEARLRELLAGSRSQEIQEARAIVEDARAQHEQAQADWQRGQKLYGNDDISRAQYDQYKARLDSTAAALKRAQENLKLVEEGPRAEQIDSARAQLEQAKASLRMTEATQLELKRKEEELETGRAEVERARAQVLIVDSQLDDTVVRSPINGVVLVKSAELGEVLAAGTTFATIGDLDNPWLRAYINERDLGRVKLGMKAKISTDSYPGKVYWGRVSFISSEAEFTPKQIQTAEERVKLVYRIKIEVSNPQHELKSNMPADAEILFNE